MRVMVGDGVAVSGRTVGEGDMDGVALASGMSVNEVAVATRVAVRKEVVGCRVGSGGEAFPQLTLNAPRKNSATIFFISAQSVNRVANTEPSSVSQFRARKKSPFCKLS